MKLHTTYWQPVLSAVRDKQLYKLIPLPLSYCFPQLAFPFTALHLTSRIKTNKGKKGRVLD
jgi:hypothetical protein